MWDCSTGPLAALPPPAAPHTFLPSAMCAQRKKQCVYGSAAHLCGCIMGATAALLALRCGNGAGVGRADHSPWQAGPTWPSVAAFLGGALARTCRGTQICGPLPPMRHALYWSAPGVPYGKHSRFCGVVTDGGVQDEEEVSRSTPLRPQDLLHLLLAHCDAPLLRRELQVASSASSLLEEAALCGCLACPASCAA